jgi:hypothetical protein
MPQLLNTPEHIFRTHGCGYWSLRLKIPDTPETQAEALTILDDTLGITLEVWELDAWRALANGIIDDMNTWREAHIPQVHDEALCPSEYSGFIIGGGSHNAMYGDEQAIAAFIAQFSQWLHDDNPLFEYIYVDTLPWRKRLLQHEVVQGALTKPPLQTCFWVIAGERCFVVQASPNQTSTLISAQDALYLIETRWSISLPASEVHYGYCYVQGEANSLFYQCTVDKLEFDFSAVWDANPAAHRRIATVLGLSTFDAPRFKVTGSQY